MQAVLVGMGYSAEDSLVALKATGELGKAVDWIEKLGEVSSMTDSDNGEDITADNIQDQDQDHKETGVIQEATEVPEVRPQTSPVSSDSAAADTDDIDLTTRPTDAEPSLSDILRDSDIVNELFEMGFTGPDAVKAAQEAQGDIKTAVKMLVRQERERGTVQRHLAAPATNLKDW